MTTNRNTTWKSACKAKLEVELNSTEKILRGYIVDPDFRFLLVKRARRICVALERIELGKYGQCIKCGHEINHERLLAYPYAEFCMNCQTRWDYRHTPLKFTTSISRGVQ